MKYLETDLGFYRRAAYIAIPVTFQNFITIGVNMMDTIMLGALGETALSASSLANQFINLFQICCMGIGMGATVLTARYWGKKDGRALRMTVTLALRFCTCLALVFMLLSLLAPDRVLRLYTKEADVLQQGRVYLLWSLPTFLLGGLSVVITNILRSVNLVRVPLYASLAAFFLNVGANYIFIFGKLGMPAMGIAGAALGTVLARVLEFCVIFGFLLRDQTLQYRPVHLALDCHSIRGEYIRISIPVLISDSLLGLGNNAVAMVMGHIGAAFVSANAITTVVQQLSTVFTQGIAFSAAVVTGQTLGQGRTEDAKRHGYTFFWCSALLGLIACFVILVLSEPIIGAYNITEGTRQIARELMRAIGFIVVFQSMNSVLTKGVLRGGGDTRFLMFADILFLWLLSVPLGYFAGLVWELPPFWVYLCLKSDQVVKALWCVGRLHSGKWIKKIRGS